MRDRTLGSQPVLGKCSSRLGVWKHGTPITLGRGAGRWAATRCIYRMLFMVMLGGTWRLSSSNDSSPTGWAARGVVVGPLVFKVPNPESSPWLW